MSTLPKPVTPAVASGSRRRLRVLQVINSLNFGGAENVVVKLALGVDATRFEMAVCCTQAIGPLGEPLVRNGVEVKLAGPSGRVHNVIRPYHVQRVLAEFRPDIVHTHALTAIAEIGPLAMVGLVPRWVHTYHYGNYPYKGKRHHMPVERFFSGYPDQLVAVAERQRRAVIEHHRVDPSRIITIPNGIAANPLAGDRDLRERKRRELGLPLDATVVGSVSVLTEQKGMTYFLQAAQQILEHRPDVRFLIVGGGPLKERLRREASERGLASAVQFTGWRMDVSELLCCLDFWVMSSLWEALPVALLEALAAGLPVVVTDVGDNAIIAGHGARGVVVPPADAGAIARSLLALFADPGRAAQLAKAGRTGVDREYSNRMMVQRYEAAYAPAHSSVSEPAFPGARRVW